MSTRRVFTPARWEGAEKPLFSVTFYCDCGHALLLGNAMMVSHGLTREQLKSALRNVPQRAA